MIITNKHSLPDTILKACQVSNYPPTEGRISVTDLIGSPLIRQLKLKHWGELEQDCSDMLWLILGKAGHYVLQQSGTGQQEQKLTAEIDGITISGISDMYNEGVITDFKFSSVWSFLLGDKPEWANQLNCYSFLHRQAGQEVKALKIHAILRDWQGSKVNEDNYPVIPFQSIDIPLWSTEHALEWIKGRIAIHKAGAGCSDAERWKRPDTWAVKKIGFQRALRVFESEKEAQKFFNLYGKQFAKTNLIIEQRAGSYQRCFQYCMVSKFCPILEKEKTA